MIKVVKCEYDHMIDSYVLDLNDGDQVIIAEENYNRIMLHKSVNGKTLEAVVDEHEEDYGAAIEYLGFMEVK